MAEPIPTDTLFDITSIMELAVSPSGARVAFVANEFNEREDERPTAIYTVPTDGSADPHRLTRASKARMAKWSPDGNRLAFIADREEDLARSVGPEPDEDDEEANGGNDEEPEAQVWVFDLKRGGDAKQLTDREHGVREFDWGPDGRRIVIAARDPTDEQAEYLERRQDNGPIEIERLQTKMDGVGYTDDVKTYLFVVDIETGEETRLDNAYGEGAYEPLRGLQPRWHPTADEIAFVNTEAERPDDSAVSDIFTVAVESGEITRITDLDRGLMQPHWSPDGEWLTFSGRMATNWYLPTEVFVASRDGDTVRSVSEDLDATVSWMGTPRFVDNETIIAGFGDEGWSRFYHLFTDASDPHPLEAGFDDDRSLRFFDVQAGTVAYTISDPSDGHDVFVASIDELVGGIDAPTRLTDLNRDFVDEHTMASFCRFVTETDEATVESMVYYPDSFDPDDPTPHPLLLWMHGGPMSYDDPEFNFNFHYFTSRGYLIVKPNYRGSVSYGAGFAEVLKGKWGTVEVDDMLAVTDDLVDRGWADPDRLFPMGFSYGGISTGYLITQSNRYTAAAAEHGIYDLRSDYSTGDSQVWMANEFGLPWEAPEVYEAASSITDVDGVETPTLVTAGQQDWRCHPAQSEQLYVSIRKQGVPAKLVLYPDENHNVGKPARAKHRLEEIAAWFDRHDPASDDA